MRQRNDGAYPLVANTDPPQVVQPGEAIEHPEPLIGFTPIPDPVPEPDAKAGKSGKEPQQ